MRAMRDWLTDDQEGTGDMTQEPFTLVIEGITTGAGMIVEERRRQVEEEGYGPRHDGGLPRGDLITAALAYAQAALAPGDAHAVQDALLDWWPWATDAWRPTGDAVRDLVKAGALIAAAIDAEVAMRGKYMTGAGRLAKALHYEFWTDDVSHGPDEGQCGDEEIPSANRILARDPTLAQDLADGEALRGAAEAVLRATDALRAARNGNGHPGEPHDEVFWDVGVWL